MGSQGEVVLREEEYETRGEKASLETLPSPPNNAKATPSSKQILQEGKTKNGWLKSEGKRSQFIHQGSDIKITSCKAVVKSHFLPSEAHTHNGGSFQKQSKPPLFPTFCVGPSAVSGLDRLGFSPGRTVLCTLVWGELTLV